MANKDITIKRKTSSGTDTLYPTTTWGQITSDSIPDDFNPSPHTHGNINDDGEISDNQAIASGDRLVISDSSDSNKLTNSAISFGTSTSTFLRNDGTWGTVASSFNGGTITNNLRIESGSFASLILDRGTTGSGSVVQFENNNGIIGGIGAYGDDGLQFRTTDGTQMVLDSSNRLGVGTLTPTERLDVGGNVIISGDNRYMTFGTPGAGTTTGARFFSIEGNTDTSGEGSGRIFFTEHNSTTAAMDNYGMSLGYRGGASSIEGASGNTWSGLSQISNGQWGMWGHNNSAAGALIMSGDRSATFIDLHNNELKNIGGANFSSAVTIDTGGSSSTALTIQGTTPTISILDDDSSADDFYIHINSNNFYVLTDRDGGNQVGAGYETPHPLQLEADTNTAYTFGSKIITDTTATQNINGILQMGNSRIDFNANGGDSVTAQFVGDRSTTDLDSRNFTTEGGFSYTTFDGSTSNKPSGSYNNANGVITMNTHSGSYNWQLAFTNNQGKMFARYRNGGSYSSWNEMLTSASTIDADTLGNVAISSILQKSGGTMTGDLVMEHDGTGTVSSHGIVFTSQFNNGDVVRELNTNSSGELIFNSNAVATESYVDTAISNLVDSSPDALNTLNELAAALGDDENFSTTMTNSLAGKLNLTGGTLTGTLTSRSINMQNYTLSGVGQMSFNDPGPNEGISWSGGNFSIYESPNDLSTNSAGNLQFVSGGSRRLTVQTDGTVYAPGAIQSNDSVVTPEVQMTSNPARNKIRVWSGGTYGMGMTSGFTYGGLGATGGEYAMTFQMNDDDDRGFWWGDSVHTGAQGAMALTTAGQLTVADKIRVGYGQSDTTTPADFALDANGDIKISNSNPVLRLNDTGTTTGDAYIDYQAGTSLKVHAGGDALTFVAGNAERARIASGGNFGIGTTSPASKLEVAGDIQLQRSNEIIFGETVGGNPRAVIFSTENEFSSDYNGLGFSIGNQGRTGPSMYIRSDGKVGIGTTTPAEKLTVSGNISVTGTVDGVDIAALNTTVAGKLNATAAAAAITYVTSCPTSNNTTGMKVYVGSTDCSTKYSGWLYLIT